MMIQLPFSSQVPTRTLFVSRDGMCFRVSGGARIVLAAASPLRKILASIVAAHREGPRRSLSVAEIFDAGWEGANLDRHALANRVYCAISKLRRMGLGDVLNRTQTGYRLEPRCCVIEDVPLRMAS